MLGVEQSSSSAGVLMHQQYIKKLRDVETRNHKLGKQLKQLMTRNEEQATRLKDQEKQIQFLKEEVNRQTEIIHKYDQKWKQLESNAREKLRRRTKSLPRLQPGSMQPTMSSSSSSIMTSSSTSVVDDAAVASLSLGVGEGAADVSSEFYFMDEFSPKVGQAKGRNGDGSRQPQQQKQVARDLLSTDAGSESDSSGSPPQRRVLFVSERG